MIYDIVVRFEPTFDRIYKTKFYAIFYAILFNKFGYEISLNKKLFHTKT